MRLLFLIVILIQTSNLYSQSENSIVYYINGKILKEHVSIGFQNNVLIKKNERTAVLDYNMIKRIEITDPIEKVNKIYEYVYVKNKKTPFLMELLYEGKKVKLYARRAYRMNMINQTNNPSSISTSEMSHYGQKKNEKYVEQISFEGIDAIYGNKFNKKGSKFFSDCPELAKKIDSKEIKNKDKIKAFEFYEKNCD